MNYTMHMHSPVGLLLLASEGEALTGLWLEGQKYYAATLSASRIEQPDLPVFAETKKWLDAYFAGQNPNPSALPLAPQGSEFRKAVWHLLCDIPYGSTVTYGQLAKQIAAQMDKPTMSGQAVGGAVAHNPISIIIPCHRVVGGNGSLTGYAGGLARQIQLLTLEGVDLSALHTPVKGTAL